MEKCHSVMVVDDEQVILALLNRILKAEGYEVLLASDGSSALDMLEQNSPDLVILDIAMPGLNGFQTLHLLREVSNIPVIMLTANREETSVRDALTLGADDYIRKPFHTPELLARIRAKLRRSQN
ncbi:MAG: response regulator [Dehalococcoidales bacterium]|nr:response regulator [Dehalococcoidales bacterium]